MWVKNCIIAPPFIDGWRFVPQCAPYDKGCYPQQRWSDCVCTGGKPRLRLLAEQTRQQRNQGDAHQSNAAASHELFYPQLGVKLCSMAGGGVQKIYMVFLREPSRRDRSGSDLFHLRDGFEIKMNFDRNVSCFIFVNALMHDDFFD